MIIGLLGFFGFLACIILMIISAVKKNGNVKKWGIGIAACFVIFVAAAVTSPPTSPATAQNTTTKTTETTVAPTETTVEVTARAAVETVAETATEATTTPVTEKQKNGIDPDKFDVMAKEKLDEINKDNVISKYNTTVYGTTASVKLYLSDLSFWDAVSDTQKKEFMNNMGNLMDGIASVTAYPGTKTISTSTTLYSPGGMELAERTVFGNIKLK